MHLQGLWVYGDKNWKSILDLCPPDKGHISERSLYDEVWCSFALHLLLFCLPNVQHSMNIHSIYAPQVAWLYRLPLTKKKSCVVKNRQRARVRPHTWLRCVYTTWWDQAVNKHAMDINSSAPPPDPQLSLLATLGYNRAPCGFSPEQQPNELLGLFIPALSRSA